jgi:hypothetical protein
MKEQLTAVEYIKEKLLCDEYWYKSMTFEQIFEQAISIEKQQIKTAYLAGNSFGIDVDNNLSPSHYYNETFKSE